MRTTNWTKLGEEAADKLKDLTDEKEIAAIGRGLVERIYSEKHTPPDRSSALKVLTKVIRNTFPIYEQNPNNPLYRETGKSAKKWRHLIFDYVTLTQEDYDALDPRRVEYRERQQAKSTNQITVDQIMEISQLELNDESAQLVQEAITRANISLSEFLKKAVVVYAKTLVKKAEVSEADLAGVSTFDLLNDKKYQTHPGRAPELTKRAVIAIKKHNASVPETEDRWHITQSAITRLTGSRPAAVAEALKQFQDDIEELKAIGLNPYSNRKGKDLEGNPREIENEINLVELVPDGYTD